MIDLLAIDHVGIRVIDADRSLGFYQTLGFSVVGRHDDHGVIILRNGSGIELNFIVNGAPFEGGKNPLMDIDEKYPGYTHVALRVASLAATQELLERAGIELSGGPIRLGNGTSLFLRDPDRNVVELREAD